MHLLILGVFGFRSSSSTTIHPDIQNITQVCFYNIAEMKRVAVNVEIYVHQRDTGGADGCLREILFWSFLGKSEASTDRETSRTCVSKAFIYWLFFI